MAPELWRMRKLTVSRKSAGRTCGYDPCVTQERLFSSAVDDYEEFS
jgi:hypothetical protein